MTKKDTLAQRLKLAKQELASALDNEPEPTKPLKQTQTAPKEPQNQTIYSGIEPKLYVSGRFDRKKYTYNSKAFYINQNLDNEIKAFCRGTDITIYNYLIFMGLKAVKSLEKIKNAEASEIEEEYSNI